MSGEKSSFSMLKHLKREEAGGIESLCFVWMGGLCGTPLHFLRESSVELVRRPCSLSLLGPLFWLISSPFLSLPTHVPVFLLNPD